MGDSRPGNKGFSAGVFLVDKPRGASSFAMVRHIRRLLGIKKVGHAGTLDPFATGLLIICAGRPATRMIERFMAGKKVYRAVAQLGVETETMDPEGKDVMSAPVPRLKDEELRSCLEKFIGSRKQVPPAYSAVKYKGKPLYHYARKGLKIVKEARDIDIHSLAFVGYDPDTCRLDFEVSCSRGTYIRVLASDIGQALGCGAHLVELRRLGSGQFSVADSLPGDALSGPDGLRILMDGMLTVEQALVMLDDREDMNGEVRA
jgi:tRNA pseudouridine55 synthase